MAWSAGGEGLQILRHAPLSCGMHDHTPQISPLLVLPMLGPLSALCSLRGELVCKVGGVEGERDGARAPVAAGPNMIGPTRVCGAWRRLASAALASPRQSAPRSSRISLRKKARA